MSDVPQEGVAIIGMAGRFPGAENVGEFWANLIAGVESISFFSDAELAESGLDLAALKSRGQYIPARGVLKDADCFDAAFFGIHPREAEVMDPQQRVFLEACWAALENAGYAPNRLPGAAGVFAGASSNTYVRHVLEARPDLMELMGAEQVMYGNDKDYLTTRVAYKLGLRGPALNVSTACSTSLVAVAQACQSLMTYQCDVALAGGTSVRVPQKRGYHYDEGNIGSSDGHTRTFDAEAAGTVFSNGVAVVVLKRLEDAINDGDRIYAVIKGAALNNDGSQRVSFGAPGVEGQSEVIAMAHALAGVDPETITYVEAHGTATPLGDPIEVAGLTKAFRLGTQTNNFCALGSVKTNVGHLDVAAGVTGLIKTALSLENKVIPASLHFTRPNPKLELDSSPFYVNAALKDWKTSPGIPRRAGVSSFGTGGTNAHLVLEEAPELPPTSLSRPWQLLALSAKTPDALDRATQKLSEYLKRLDQRQDLGDRSRELADAAFTLQTGRSEFVHRRVVVCADAAAGATALDAMDPKRVFTHHQQLREPPVVFMFPGQGAQYAGMGAELYRSEPAFRSEVDRCAELLQPVLQTDLRTVIFPAAGFEKEAEQLLTQTRFTQPALFTIEYALAKLWMSWGIKPAAMIGHSVGEYVAGCLAGVFTLEDALLLVARRAALVQAQAGGTMLAIRLPEKDVLPMIDGQLSIAAINSPGMCVVAGPDDAIAALEAELGSRGLAAKRLQTSHAFHSAMMDPVVEPFTELLRSVRFSEPQIPYISNVSAKWIASSEATSPEYWAAHIRQTVRFADGIAELMKDPNRVLLEVGPGQTLSTFARQHPAKPAEQIVLASMPLTGAQEPRGILEALGRLWMAGAPVDWAGFYANERRRRTVLPSYPFERKRYWPEPSAKSAHISNASTAVPMPQTASPAADGNGIHVSMPAAQSSESAPLPPQETVPDAQLVPRKDNLRAGVRILIEELSGYDLSKVDAETSLFELGLDSLLLTQATQLFQRKFGVSITFRQLMEELGSIEDIATHLDSVLPPEAFASTRAVPSAPAPLQASALPASVATSASTAGSTSQSVLEQLLQQQQQLTNQLLQLLGRAPAASPAASATATPTFAARPLPFVDAPKTEAKPDGNKSHGPFKPIDRGAHAAASPQQAKALAGLIERYIARTTESKKHAVKNRPILADPRSVSGFNRLWKEMVYPIYTTRSDGSRVWDVDGNEYIDFVMGFGASMFGHRPPFVVKAVQEQLDKGFEIGPIQPLAGEVAALVREFTGKQRVAFTNTGSEAVLAATRVSRTVTGRDKIAVFAGAYHGIFDEVLFRPLTVNGETRTAPIAPGVPGSALQQVIVLEYGNSQSLEILRTQGSEIAAVLVEPVQSRRLDLQPAEFMRELRTVTHETGSALIFDEVVTGFRVHPGGAQAYFGVNADLATYGKVIGGGLPIGVVAGDPKFMDALDGGQWEYGDASFPEIGVTFFAGTFVRHPLALAAAKAVLIHLKENGPELQRRLAERTADLVRELQTAIDDFGAPYRLTHFSSLIQLGFSAENKFAALLFYFLRQRGIHIWENRAFVITTAHTDEDLAKLVRAFRESLAEMQSAEFLPAPAGIAVRSAVPDSPGSSRSAKPAAEDVQLTYQFPTTEAQKEIWLAAQMGGNAAVGYNESLKLEFRGGLDVGLFHKSVNRVLERHPILLASFGPDGQWQRIPRTRTIDMPVFDLARLNTADQQTELAALVEREVSEPFNLLTGPLLRVKIVTLTPEHHVVIWTAHHIVCDGWSGGLIINELSKIYSALAQSIEPELPTPISFSQYVRETEAESSATRDAMEYWRKRFAELPPPLDLPVDRPRSTSRSARASTVKRMMDASLQQSLKRTAAQQRSTLVVLLMAGFQAMLHRLTGQTDVVVGLGVAGQAVTGNTCLVGHCLNLVPIRTKLQPEASFQDNLAIVKKVVLDAYDHYQSTLGGILQHLKVPRNAARPPLVEVIFNIDRDPGDTQFRGLEFGCDRNPKRALHFDLFFNFVEGPRGIYIECDYNTDLFDASTIERWLGHCQTILESIAANPVETLDKLPILNQAERKQLLIDWNDTRVAFPRRETLQQWFESQAAKTPDARALTFEDVHLTYAELNRRANQLAHRLQTLGVGPDVLVALVLERSIEMVVGIFGVLKAGGAYVPIDPEYPSERVAFMLQDAGAPVLLTQERFAQQLPPHTSHVIRLDADWEKIAREDAANPVSAASSDNLAYMIYTSGSTGTPKGAMNTHRGICNRLLWMQDEYCLSETDRVLQKTPFSFDVSVWEFFWPLLHGAQLVIAKPGGHRDTAYLVKLITEKQITVLHFVPSMLGAFLNQPGVERCRSLRDVICSGEALPLALQQQFFSLLPARLHNLYGPTETAVDVTYWPCRFNYERNLVPIGRPVSNTQVYIVDRYLQPTPIGVPGELYIGGIQVGRGYHNRPELTAERFVPDPFTNDPGARLYKTGDLCRWLADGNIEYLGRLDFQVKIRGLRVELGEIEAVLDRHPAVRQSVVTVYQDTDGDKLLAAYFEAQPGSVPDVGDLRAHLKVDLPDYMIPSVFVPMEKLPLTPNGKVDRKALPAPIEGRLQVKGDFVAPRDPLEQSLANIWAKVLKVDRVGVHDNFFEMGGHSFAALRLLSQVEKLTGKTLPLATLFEAATVESLAEILRREGWKPSWSSLVPIQPFGSKPPLFLVHGAEGNILLYRQVARHLEADQPVYGLQSQGLNGAARVHTTVQEMAEHYVKEIRNFQPSGPYYLGGYCLGGIIAFEMAQQLTAAGERVDLLALLDTYNLGVVSQSKLVLQIPLHFLENLWFHIANAFSVPSRERKKFIREKLDIAAARMDIRFRAAYDAFRRLGNGKTPHKYPHLMVKKINDNAADAYLPQPYSGRVIVVRGKAYFSGLSSPSLGWDHTVKDGLQVRELQAYPKGILIEPFCAELAAVLNEALHEAHSYNHSEELPNDHLLNTVATQA